MIGFGLYYIGLMASYCVLMASQAKKLQPIFLGFFLVKKLVCACVSFEGEGDLITFFDFFSDFFLFRLNRFRTILYRLSVLIFFHTMSKLSFCVCVF